MAGKHLTQGEVLTAMHKGAVITCEYRNDPPSDAKKMYRLSSTNKHVPRRLIAVLLANGLIEPCDDGLPEIGESQTYRVRRNLTE